MSGPPLIDKQRLQELRDVLSKIDPADRKDWILEVYDLCDGAEVIRAVVDIRTGKPYKRAGLKEEQDG